MANTATRATQRNLTAEEEADLAFAEDDADLLLADEEAEGNEDVALADGDSSSDDEEEYADAAAAADAADEDMSSADEEAYADAEDLADEGDDEAAEGEPPFNAKSDRHSAMVTTGKGHKHGKYGLHTHEDDADHGEAPMAMAEASQAMSEASAALAGLPEGVALAEPVRRYLAELERDRSETRARLAELEREAYTKKLSERVTSLQRTLRFADGGTAKVAPTRRFAEAYKALMLSDDVRQLSEASRERIDALLETAYKRGAVLLGQISREAPEGVNPPAAAQSVERAIKPAAPRKPGTAAQVDLMALSESVAQEAFNTSFDALKPAERLKVMKLAADRAGYQGAEAPRR